MQAFEWGTVVGVLEGAVLLVGGRTHVHVGWDSAMKQWYMRLIGMGVG